MKKMAYGQVVVMAALYLGNVARGDLFINIDFQPGGSGGGTSVTFSGQGAMATPGNLWNTLDPSTDGSFNGEFGSGGTFDFVEGSFVLGSLLDSEGLVTGVQLELFKGSPDSAFALNPLNGGDVNVASDGKELMRDFLIAGDPNAVNITGLADGGFYTLYLYGAGDNSSQTTMFTIGGISKTTTGVTGSHALSEGVDYVVFQNVQAIGGFIGIEYTPGGESAEGHFNGLQLMEVIPEPSTVLLSGLGFLVMFWRSRRRGVL